MATYLVTQATGRQSQYTIEHLLAAGAKVHAVVRNTGNLPPILKRPEVTVFKGETADFDAVYQAAQGCRGVFLNTFPYPPGNEDRQSKNVIAVCKKAGIENIVASTTFLTNRKDLWGDDETKQIGLDQYYLSKTAIEDNVRAGGFKAYTIVRPAYLHFDYYLPAVMMNYPTLPSTGELLHAFDDGCKMAHTDGSDLGRYAAAALLDPAKFAGEEIDLGNESLAIEEVRDILAKVSGKDVRVRKKTPEEIAADAPTLSGQRFQLWKNSHGSGDTAAMAVQAKYGIPFHSLEEALQRDKARLVDSLP